MVLISPLTENVGEVYKQRPTCSRIQTGAASTPKVLCNTHQNCGHFSPREVQGPQTTSTPPLPLLFFSPVPPRRILLCSPSYPPASSSLEFCLLFFFRLISRTCVYLCMQAGGRSPGCCLLSFLRQDQPVFETPGFSSRGPFCLLLSSAEVGH